MKIVSYELYQVQPRWLFLKILTNSEIHGWGEPVIEGRAATVAAAVNELMENLIGKDPLNIEDHWNTLYRGGFYRGGPVLMSAIAGIDQALWDIKGKFFNAPAWQLMGGKARDKIRVYSWIGGDRPTEVVQQAKIMKDKGFTAVKMNAVNELQIVDSHSKIDQVIERIGALRDNFGRDFGIGIDFHGRVHKPMAKVLAKALEPFSPMFIEEP
ncbi:MAG TPA: galactonate dehydratase, partial [Cyclobacteriaceae bacterium]|nr:galactonate dehydratase [Cyclobacteriaceae bacterium]